MFQQNPMQTVLNKIQGNGMTVPGATLSQMMEVMKQVNQFGGDPQKAFYELAKQRGVDPQAVINMAKNLGFKI